MWGAHISGSGNHIIDTASQGVCLLVSLSRGSYPSTVGGGGEGFTKALVKPQIMCKVTFSC